MNAIVIVKLSAFLCISVTTLGFRCAQLSLVLSRDGHVCTVMSMYEIIVEHACPLRTIGFVTFLHILTSFLHFIH